MPIPFRVFYYNQQIVDYICEDETTVLLTRTVIRRRGKPRMLTFLNHEPTQEEQDNAKIDGRYIYAARG